MNRSLWYQWHHWLGLKLAILLCFILATGAIAVVSNELDWLSNAAIRVSPTTSGTAVAWEKIYNNLSHEAKGQRIVSINAPIHQGFAAQAIVKDQHGERSRLYFHPTTGVFQGSGQWFNWQTVIRRLHRHLMMPATLGITLVTLTSLLFLGSLISGLVLHPKWFAGLWRLPRRNNPRIFWGELHRLLGLWSTWLLLIVSLTGVWYLAERWGLDASYPENGSIKIEQQHYRPKQQQFVQMLAAIPKRHHQLTLKKIRFAAKAHQPIIFEGQAATTLVRDRANNLAFDPRSGHWLSTRHGSELSLHLRISEAADPLHFGTWGGYPSKIIYFVFGLLLTTVAISGSYIYALRVTKVSRQEKLLTATRLHSLWQKMGIGKWISSSLILVALVLTLLNLMV